jgi:hypothetical protein
LLLAIISLFAGLVLYALFRNAHFIAYNWVGMPNVVHTAVLQHKNPLGTILVYSVPDGLWLLSGIFLIRAVWCTNQKWCARYVRCFCAIGLLWEFLQAKGVTPGTFDVWDVTLLSAAAIIEGIVYTYGIKRRYKHEK